MWLFGGGSILYCFFPREKVSINEKIEERWKWLPAVILSVPYVIWAGFRTWFGDTEVYRQLFLNAPTRISSIASYITENTKDKGFSVFMIFFKTVLGNSDVLFFLVIAIIQMGCVVWFFRKYSCNYWISFFLFIVSTDYLSWMHNGMRQFIATAIVLIATDLLIKKRYGYMVVLILIAALFHGSAIMMLPIMFIVQGKSWNHKTIVFILISLTVVFFVDRFTPVLAQLLSDTQYSDMMTNEIWTSDNGTNILRAFVYSVPAIISLIGMPYLKQANDRTIDIFVNCSIVTMMLYLLSTVTSGIYIGRLPIYTTLQGYISVPWLLENIFEENSGRMINILMMGAYLLFFYYQMHMAWGML